MRSTLFAGLAAPAALLLLSAVPPAPAHAEPLTVWAAGGVASGGTKRDVDYAVGIDIEVLRRSETTFAASIGYIHALTADAGNVHRFPVLALVRREIGDPTRLVRPYVGAGAGLIFSDENSPDIGVSDRTAFGWALLVGAPVGSRAVAELRYVASERPSKDGTFLLLVGLGL